MVSRTCLSPKIQQFVYSAMLPAMLAFSFNGPPVQAQEASTAPALETAIADLSRKLLPSVARITSTIDAEIYSPRRENRSSRPFSPFSPGADIMRQESTGSGVIISPDGYIVTNVHVVEGAQQITVTLADNRSFSADIIGLDRFTEIAVIKIAADKLPYARLGRSSDCRVGDWVIAIGNPMNLHS
ncbi:MAG TPA: deoxyribonuclease HsdR, partial [Bacteroidetes bacterium]|nr:deoxyribonuclease HsdR [Bacteroidota bacterium]